MEADAVSLEEVPQISPPSEGCLRNQVLRFRESRTRPRGRGTSSAGSPAVRFGFTLVELLVVVFVIGILVSLLLPGIQAARETGRRAACQNNQRQFGLALHCYAAVKEEFPPGADADFTSGGATIFANANAILLPYFEQVALADRYDASKPYWEQELSLVRTSVPVFSCPSNGDAPFINADLQAYLPVPLGEEFGTTDYAYCRGATDAWCVTLLYPLAQKGVFTIGESTKLSQVSDGLSNTIAMGEAAGGDRWPVCNGPGCDLPDASGITADVPWVIGNLAADFMLPQLLTSSVYGSTVEPPNKWPVTNTMLDTASVLDCGCSKAGGRHRVSNFRSDHPGGALFLYCDGSVQFLTEDIDLAVYRDASTIAGENN